MLDWFYLVLPSLKGKGDRVSGGRVLSAAYALKGFDKLLKERLELCNKVSDDVDYCPFAVALRKLIHIKAAEDTVNVKTA